MGGDRHLGKGSLLVPLFASRLAPDAALILSDVALEAESSRSWPALCLASSNLPRTARDPERCPAACTASCVCCWPAVFALPVDVTPP